MLIAGAALDVFAQEPTPEGYQLFTAPNLIVTPHVGASTYESMERTNSALAEEFRRFFSGEKSVRTALYNYLFARQHGGDLIFRIEDTDSNRFVPGAEEYIIESFKWLGINFDEGVSFGGN